MAGLKKDKGGTSKAGKKVAKGASTEPEKREKGASVSAVHNIT